MKTRNSIIAMMSIALMSAVIVMFSACEKDKATEAVDDFFGDSYSSANRDSEQPEGMSLSPNSPSINTVGEQVAFTVKGGHKPYTWTVSDATVGTVTPSTTASEIEQVIYKALKLAQNTVVVTDAMGRAAVVDVTAGSTDLKITPTTVAFLATELAAAQSVQFAGNGGVPPYTWGDSLPLFGSIDGNGLWTTLAQTAASWSNKTVTIVLTDSNGDSTSATITAN
jgi:hypothetical protein